MSNLVTTLDTSAAAVKLTLTSDDVPCRVSCVGLSGSEECAIQHVMNGVPFDSGSILTSDAPGLGIYVPGEYRINKPGTTGNSGICVDGVASNSINVE